MNALEQITQKLTYKHNSTTPALTYTWWELLNCWYRTQSDKKRVVAACCAIKNACARYSDALFNKDIPDALAYIQAVVSSKRVSFGGRLKTVFVGIMVAVLCGLAISVLYMSKNLSCQAPSQAGSAARNVAHITRNPWLPGQPLSIEERQKLTADISKMCTRIEPPVSGNLPRIRLLNKNDIRSRFITSATSPAHLSWWLFRAYGQSEKWFDRMLTSLCYKQAGCFPSTNKLRYLNTFNALLVRFCAPLIRVYITAQERSQKIRFSHIQAQSVAPLEKGVAHEVATCMVCVANPLAQNPVRAFFSDLPASQHNAFVASLAEAVLIRYAHATQSDTTRGALHATASCLVRMRRMLLYWKMLLAQQEKKIVPDDTDREE